MQANACLLFPKTVKVHNFVKKHDRVMVLGQIVALVMVKNYLKFHKIRLNSKKVLANVKVLYDKND